MLKTLRKILIFLFTIGFIISAFLGYKIYQTTQYKNPQDITIMIKRGSSVKKIAQILQEEDLIKNKWVFEIYLRVMGKGKQLKAGEYEFKKGMTLDQIIEQMVQGKVKLYKFTIPEGYNIKSVCKVMTEKKLMTADECRKQIFRVDILKDKKNIQNLEGYLFPETYFYDAEFTPAKLTEQMVKTFYQKIGEERIKKAKQMGYSLQKLLTFASVIEKETGVESERPLIAAVFHNRLKKGMLLQTDPTVIYGIEEFDGNLTRKHLETDTPYNTYIRPGLPKGPICNPGLDSIDAVLNPAKSDYLYFVAKGDGSHYFSKNIDQHNKAVRYYQLKQGDPP